MIIYYKIVYEDNGKIEQTEVNLEEFIPMLLEIKRYLRVVYVEDQEGKKYNIEDFLEEEKEKIEKELKNKTKEEIIYAMQKKLTELIKKELIYERDFSLIMTEIRRQKDRIENVEEFKNKVIKIYLNI